MLGEGDRVQSSSMNQTASNTSTPIFGRAVALVAAFTVVGLLLRVWGLGRLGLIHFDEGIYAIAGLWSLSPRGLAALDPVVISYSPPGFPILVGLSYAILGAADVSAILVSILAGALTIPAAAWLAGRTFGAGAAAPAAALTALSGFHVAFSRMALTDASFLLCWVVGLIVAQRFLERPTAGSGIVLGVAVGVAQLFKYSGWTLGAAAILGLFAVALGDASRRTWAHQARAWGFGLLGAVVSLGMYAPWFWFVENHGGYRALMAHHGGYVGSAGSWLPHWRVQLEQLSALSGGFPWNAAGWLLALGAAVAGGLGKGTRPEIGRLAMLGLVVGTGIVAPTWLWWVGFAGLTVWGRDASPGRRLLGVSWLGLSILTPFYHPYARLWLPIQALGWIAAAGLIAELLKPREPGAKCPLARLSLVGACCLAALVQGLVFVKTPSLADRGGGLLAPSDSLRRAVAATLVELPKGASNLRLLARPPVIYYLAGRTEARVEPDWESLARDGSGRWALLDWAQLRQSRDADEIAARLLEHWEKVGERPTKLNLPTLLDIDPGAALTVRPTEAEAPLWLLRRREHGAP